MDMQALKILAICVMIILAYVLYEAYEHINFKITKTELNPSGCSKTLKIVLVSDLHDNKIILADKFLGEIKKFAPDYILICGDLINKHSVKISNAVDLVKNLSSLGTVIFSYGNHEEKLKKDEIFAEFIRQISSYCVILNNGLKIDENVQIMGLSLDSGLYRHSFNKEKEKIKFLPKVSFSKNAEDSDKLRILMAHDPSLFEEYIECYKPNLVFSGHVHGGLARLPFLGGVISPRIQFFPKYDKGLFKKKDTFLFVSGGIGSHGLPVRFFNRTEINFLTLKGSN